MTGEHGIVLGMVCVNTNQKRVSSFSDKLSRTSASARFFFLMEKQIPQSSDLSPTASREMLFVGRADQLLQTNEATTTAELYLF